MSPHLLYGTLQSGKYPLFFPMGRCIIQPARVCRNGALSAGRMGGCRRTKELAPRFHSSFHTAVFYFTICKIPPIPRIRRFFYARKRNVNRRTSRFQHLFPDCLRPADRHERGAGAGADPHPGGNHPHLAGGAAHRAGGSAVRPHPRRAGGLRRRPDRLPVLPLRL